MCKYFFENIATDVTKRDVRVRLSQKHCFMSSRSIEGSCYNIDNQGTRFFTVVQNDTNFWLLRQPQN